MLSGTIVQDNGTTVEKNVVVNLVPTDGSQGPDDVKTGKNGTYQIALLPGSYTLNLTPDPDVVIPGDVEWRRMQRNRRKTGSLED